MALITIAQQQAIKPISPNWAATAKVAGGLSNFDSLLSEIEDYELSAMLGNEMLYDIQENPTDAKYVTLLDGSEFTTDNGNVLRFKGIKYQLAYLLYGKMVEMSHIADTFSGFVQRNRAESESISQGDRKRIQLDARNLAEADFEKMRIFLDQKNTTYTLWKCANSNKAYTPKFTTLRKTIKK